MKSCSLEMQKSTSTTQNTKKMNEQLIEITSQIFKDKDLEYILEMAKKANKLYIWNLFIEKMIHQIKHELSLIIKKSQKEEKERFLFFRRIIQKTEIQMNFLYRHTEIVEKYCSGTEVWRKISSLLLNPLYFIFEPSYDKDCSINPKRLKVVTECVLKSDDLRLLKKLARLIHEPDTLLKALPVFRKLDKSYSKNIEPHNRYNETLSLGEQWDQSVDDRRASMDIGHEWH